METGDNGQTTPNVVLPVEKEPTTDIENVKERNTAAKIVKEVTNTTKIAILVSIVQQEENGVNGQTSQIAVFPADPENITAQELAKDANMEEKIVKAMTNTTKIARLVFIAQ